MESYKQITRRFFGLNIGKPPNKDKYVVIKHNGQRKIYRINKYGELFKQKQ